MIELHCMNASDWEGEADLVFTHPYAPLPECLWGRPAVYNLFGATREQAAQRLRKLIEWTGGDSFTYVGSWGRGRHNHLYTNRPLDPVKLDDLVEDEFEPGKGWMPLDLPRRVLWAMIRHRTYKPERYTVWDGFCGRGTIGRACAELGLNYIGLDIDPERIEIAKEYLGVAWRGSWS